MTQEVRLTDSNTGYAFGKKAAYFSLFVSCMLGLLDFVDRAVMVAVYPYLKAEYALTDTQLGMLSTIVNVSIAVLVIPSGYVIDRWSRKKMMALMTIIWSVATGACAFARGYTHLLMARVFVGAGEAGYNPAAQALLTASFPDRLRATVVGILQFAMVVGQPLGILIGAWIATHWGWRHAFGIVAVPGLILAVSALFMKDFANRECRAPSDGITPSYLRQVGTLFRSPTFSLALLAQGSSAFLTMTLLTWLPSYYMRSAGMSVVEASGIASIYMFAMAASNFTAGPILDWLRGRDPNLANKYQVGANLLAFVMVLFALVCLEPGSTLQVVMLVTQCLFSGTNGILGYTVASDIAPLQLRATAVSLVVTAQNIIGMGLGPLIAGAVSDSVGLDVSLMYMSGFYFAAAVFYVGVSVFYRRDREMMANMCI